ncbi:MAG TPA: hypothetical protein PLU35_13520 [Phycisphaerales bacterium]|nr:hypothetical protein [Phycisphaerales bacterium]
MRATTMTVRQREGAIDCSGLRSDGTVEDDGGVFHRDGRFTRDGFPAPA